jgi:hypothetical protein
VQVLLTELSRFSNKFGIFQCESHCGMREYMAMFSDHSTAVINVKIGTETDSFPTISRAYVSYVFLEDTLILGHPRQTGTKPL